MSPKENSSSRAVAEAEYLRPPRAAVYTGLSGSKLAKLRMLENRHLGPRFAKVAGCVLYHRDDLDAWLAAHIVDAKRCDK